MNKWLNNKELEETMHMKQMKCNMFPLEDNHNGREKEFPETILKNFFKVKDKITDCKRTLCLRKKLTELSILGYIQ